MLKKLQTDKKFFMNDGIDDKPAGRVIIVVGMQYGSEGKGAITSYMIYHKNQKFVMRQIPSTWVNPYAKLVIGVGAIIDLGVLIAEIKLISRFTDIKNRLYIDGNAHVVTERQRRHEKKTDLARRIGST